MTMKWWRELVEQFGFGPKRKPRRGPCGCGHRWGRHGQFGCKECRAAERDPICRMNRSGIPARRALAAVKEAV